MSTNVHGLPGVAVVSEEHNNGPPAEGVEGGQVNVTDSNGPPGDTVESSTKPQKSLKGYKIPLKPKSKIQSVISFVDKSKSGSAMIQPSHSQSKGLKRKKGGGHIKNPQRVSMISRSDSPQSEDEDGLVVGLSNDDLSDAGGLQGHDEEFFGSDQDHSINIRPEDFDKINNSESEPSDVAEENWESESDSEEEAPPRKRRAIEGRFDPLGVSNLKAWELNASQNKFISEYFSTWLSDETVKQSVLKPNPVPEHDSLTVLKLDDEILDLLPQASKLHVTHFDGSFKRVQRKMLDSMGPLGKLWHKLESVARKGGGSLDAKKLLSLVEQTVLVLGQTNVLINFNRRVNILARFLKDNTKASKLVQGNASLLKKNESQLFGKAFHKALYKRAKGHKYSKEIKNELAPRSDFRGRSNNRRPFRARSQPTAGRGSYNKSGYSNSFANSYSNSYNSYKSYNSDRGRGNRGSRGASGRKFQGYKKPGYVSLFVSNVNNPSHTTHSGSPVRHEQCPPSAEGPRHDKYCPPTRRGGRQNTVVPEQLEVHLEGSSDPRNSGRSQTRTVGTTSAKSKPICPTLLKKRIRLIVHRSPGHANQRRRGNGERSRKPVRRTSVPPTKKRRIVSPSFQSEATKRVRKIRKIQDGGHADAQSPGSDKRLHVQDRHEGCICLHPDIGTRSTLPEIRLGRPTVPIQSPAVRASISPEDLHKNNEASDRILPEDRNPSDYLFGRHFDHESVGTTDVSRSQYCDVVATESGLCDKLEKIGHSAEPMSGIPGVHHKLKKDDILLAGTESSKDQECMQRPATEGLGISQGTIGSDRFVDSNSFGDSPGSITLQEIADVEVESPIVREPKLWFKNRANASVQGRTTLVGSLPGPVEWQGHYNSEPRPADASNLGWGAVCRGVTAQGQWSLEEKTRHINVLELTAAMFALKAFTKGMKDIHVHFRVDNRATLSQINKMGGPRSESLLTVTQAMWDYCLMNKIIITAEHIPGVKNVEADFQSRSFTDSSNWRLAPQMLIAAEKILGTAKVDLFADRLNTQKKQYVSWKPDPGAMAVDAFSIPWANMEALYAFPPFGLIGKCLAKLKKEKVTMTLVTPTWQTQPWYPVILQMSIATPILLPHQTNLLVDPSDKPHPLLEANQLRLAVWKVSGIDTLQVEYRRTLPAYSYKHEGKGLKQLTMAPGKSGLAGVVADKLILFRPLWKI